MFLFIFFGLFGLSNLSISAAGEFNLSKSIYYHLNSQGLATVEESVELQNNLSQIYPTQYSLTLTGLNISQVSANDDQGNIFQSLTPNPASNSTAINLKFNQPAIGKGKITSFKLRYQITDLAKIKGNTWEIVIPSAETGITISSLKLAVPKAFGPVAFASVNFTTQDKADLQELTISPKTNDKILIAFGQHQLFNFTLTYQLTNQESNSSQIKIPLPPDTGHQRVFFTNITPQPLNITADPDGNWLATYLLQGHSQITVLAKGQVETFSQIFPVSTPLPEHIQSQAIWPIDNPQIQAVAATLKNPKHIYDYVVSRLTYNYNLIKTPQRRGALPALTDPTNSLCTEFTDLFVTLARAKAIPAREIEGYALTTDAKIKPVNHSSDILHAWPQYYDQVRQSWVDIDPTWAKTTNGVDYFSDIDLNHVTLVIHGLDSHNPPAPTSHFSLASEKTPATSLPPTLKFSDNSSQSLTLYNPNLHSLKSVKINTNNLAWQATSLPPLSYTTIDLPATSWLKSLLPQNNRLKISLEYASNTTHLTLTSPRQFSQLIIIIGSITLILSVGGIILTTSHHGQKNR
jgi:hypothetical protein